MFGVDVMKNLMEIKHLNSSPQAAQLDRRCQLG